MKRVIFVCLLTLSVCLSQPADNVNPAKPEQHDAASASAATVAQPASTVAPPASTVLTPQEPAKPVPKAPDTPKSTEAAKDNATTTLVPEQKADNKTNNTTDDKKNTSSTITTTVPPTTAKTTAAEHNGTATVPVTDKSSTAKPTATTEKPPTLQARGFDGASFVGGIILTLGLLAIGFMGFKYYKAQTERNYHTL